MSVWNHRGATLCMFLWLWPSFCLSLSCACACSGRLENPADLMRPDQPWSAEPPGVCLNCLDVFDGDHRYSFSFRSCFCRCLLLTWREDTDESNSFVCAKWNSFYGWSMMTPTCYLGSSNATSATFEDVSTCNLRQSLCLHWLILAVSSKHCQLIFWQCSRLRFWAGCFSLWPRMRTKHGIL